ncbi:MAG TPA: substrate-binding domain-containing protein [Candidatus Eisenbacteria bacterium]|nr:substrate-binding domain-containing protein [Candidatus Eisenbacteria bacterium]
MKTNDEKPKRERSWRDDYFATCEILAQFWGWWIIPIIGIVGALLIPPLVHFKNSARPQVVAYTSQDQVYAEPILHEFTKQTGIEVRAVYDSEAVKTVGLANRLLAERAHPQCDVFWNNEELRTRQLAAQNVFRETNAWRAVGYRSRRVVINTNRLSLATAPRSLIELTNAAWRGKVALAYPLFGTTATHFLALRQKWGAAHWESWCRALQGNRPFLVDGNSVVVRFVGRGEAWIGLTDSDDIAAGQEEGLPIAALPINEETLLIANTIAVVRSAPHTEAAEKLFHYLQNRAVLDRLVAAHALESADGQVSSDEGQTLRVDWDSLLQNLEPATAVLKTIFLR